MASKLGVRVFGVPAGPWSAPWTPGARTESSEPLSGLLVLEGMIVRSLHVETVQSHDTEGSSGIELLGPGDVVRPWQEDGGELVPCRSTWQASEGLRLAIIDDRVIRAAGRWPALGSALLTRAVRRSRWVASMGALSTAGTARERLLLVFAHLGDRWGRVTSQGLAVPLPLTHRMLALLAGMTRPTCSSALSWLSRNGLLGRLDGGGWWLRLNAHEELPRILAAEGEAPAEDTTGR